MCVFIIEMRYMFDALFLGLNGTTGINH